MRIPLSGKHSNGAPMLVDNNLSHRFVGKVWRLDNHGYAIWDSGHGKAVPAHRLVFKHRTPFGLDIDHVNGDKLDNRRSNLRLATRAQNLQNRGITKRNTSGYKGVYWAEKDKTWTASIGYEGKQIHIGSFKHFADAIGARVGAEIELYKEFARIA